MAKLQIKPSGKNTVEVFSSKVKYLIKAGNTTVSVKAFKGRTLIEENFLRRSGTDWIMEGSDRRGSTARLRTHSTKDRMITNGVVNGERFQVDSAPIRHGPLLQRELQKRNGPQLPALRSLTNELKANKSLFHDIERHTRLSRIMMQQKGNGIIEKCLVDCWLCSGGFVMACLRCLICITISIVTGPFDPGPVIIARTTKH